jgi:HSP20 family protein
MSRVSIHKAHDGAKALPAFEELDRRVDAVRKRAFELFEQRGFAPEHDLDDWLAAEREVLGWPAAELKEKDHNYEVEVALPGFAPDEVEVSATPTDIVVHAAADREKKGETERVIWTEFGSNDVYRYFHLPQAVASEKVQAEFDEGLLRITAPLAN